MSSNILGLLFRRAAFYSFGLFNWLLFLGLFVKNGTFFKKRTEKDELQWAIGWLSLSRQMPCYCPDCVV
jgi:succinate-acetate transporter protein